MYVYVHTNSKKNAESFDVIFYLITPLELDRKLAVKIPQLEAPLY